MAVEHKQPEALLPDEMKFILRRDGRDWSKFCVAWSSHFTKFEMDTVVASKSDETMVNVWLRRKTTEQ